MNQDNFDADLIPEESPEEERKREIENLRVAIQRSSVELQDAIESRGLIDKRILDLEREKNSAQLDGTPTAQIDADLTIARQEIMEKEVEIEQMYRSIDAMQSRISNTL